MACVDGFSRRILVTGATGFIGRRLSERLWSDYRIPFRAFVRNRKNTGMFAGLGAERAHGDLLKRSTIGGALSGCDMVVHLAHGEDRDGPRATRNLVEACCKAGIARFVHLSSMSVHGPSPVPESASEDTATISRYGESYCDSKAEEEEIVQAAIRETGFPAVILRPTVVFGPRSPFVMSVLAEARAGTVTLIDEGVGQCNAVFIDDVCDAILASLTSQRALGQAVFVNADAAVTWRDFVLAFATMVEPPPAVHNVSSADASEYWALHTATAGASRGPLAAFGYRLGRRITANAVVSNSRELLGRLGPFNANRARPAGQLASRTWPSPGRISRETIRVKFANQKAKDLLDWKPRYDFWLGVQEIRRWAASSDLRDSP